MQRRCAPTANSEISVYDGADFVGKVIERADGGGFDALDATGKLIGTFPTRLQATRSIPTGSVS